MPRYWDTTCSYPPCWLDALYDQRTEGTGEKVAWTPHLLFVKGFGDGLITSLDHPHLHTVTRHSHGTNTE